MKRRFLLAIVVATVICIFAGCNVEKRIQKKSDELNEELCEIAHEFNRLIVWKGFDTAAMVVIPEKRMDFIEKAERVSSRLQIENFRVALCQTGLQPFPREKSTPDIPGQTPVVPLLPGQDLPENPAISSKSAGTHLADGEPIKAVPELDDKEADKENKDKKEKMKMPKVFYGMTLVRFQNMTIYPSNSVRSPVVKQYWVNIDGNWYCDIDLEDLLNP